MIAALLAVVLTLLAAWAMSQGAAAQGGKETTQDLASYAGADRMVTLVAGAKLESSVSLYSSAAPDDLAALTAAFDKQHGVKVRVCRGSSDKIIQCCVVAARGGSYALN